MPPITVATVQHIAALARLGITDEHAATLASELSTILGHMDELSKVKTDGVQQAIGVGARGLPARSDHGPPIALVRALDGFAPATRDGFLVVPRLSSHEAAGES